MLNLTWLVRKTNGEWYVVTIGLNDPGAPIANESLALRTALGIFDLLATE